MPPILKLADIRQKNGHSCGEVALKMVLIYYIDRKLKKSNVQACPVQGLHPTTFASVFRREGMAYTAGNMTIEDLQSHHRQGRPVVCPIQYEGTGHYIVVAGVARGKVHYQCPIIGGVVAPIAEFVSKWWDHDTEGNHFRQWGIAAWPE